MFNLDKFLMNAILRLFYIFLVLGNLARILPIGFRGDNLNIFEFLIYSLCLFYLIFFDSISRAYLWLSFFALIVLASSFYGLCLHGYSTSCFFHAIRLILLSLSSFIIGKMFYKKYNDDFLRFFHVLIKVYCWNLGLGFVLYVLFPDARFLWYALASIGILFQGDPHTGRFVSPYFDPNFWAAIGCIPCLALYNLDQWSWRDKIIFCLISLSIFCSFSRSGIGTYIFLFAILTFIDRLNVKFYSLRKYSFLILGIFASAILLLGVLRYDELSFFLHRSINIKQEHSALSRLNSFKFGVELVEEFPLLGVGYNYLSDKINEGLNEGVVGWGSLDSSMLTILATFGLVISFLFFLLFVVWSWFSFVRFRSVSQGSDELYNCFRSYYIYLLVVIFFSSHFNNILLYPFWLMPIVSMFTYFSLCLKKKEQLLFLKMFAQERS